MIKNKEIAKALPTKKERRNSFLNSLLSVGTGAEKDYLIEGLANLLGSGINISSALDAMLAEMNSGYMKKIVAWLKKDIEDGSPIWLALDAAKILPQYAISLARAGEESGKLEQNFRVIVEQRKKENLFLSRMRSAMTYPLVVLSLVVIVGTGVSWFVLPRLAGIFNSLKLELPLITKWLIAGGSFLGNYGAIFVPSFVLFLGLAIFFVFFFSKTRFIGQAILFAIPPIKKLIMEIELSRFGYSLGTLLDAGLPVNEAIASLTSVSSFRNYKNFYTFLKIKIEEGETFEAVFADYKKTNRIIPPSTQQLIISGEQSGKLSGMLKNIAEQYEEKIETTTKNLSTLTEPILLVVVWLGVMFVALAIILPIYNLIGGVNARGGVGSGPSPAVSQNIPSPSPEISELAPTPTSALPAVASNRIKILNNPLGYVNVREEPTTKSQIVRTVNIDLIFEYSEERDGWFKIILNDTQSGWVFGKYAEVVK